MHKQDGNARTTTGAGEDETSSDEDDDDEEFFDASEQVNASEQSIVVKMEVVGTSRSLLADIEVHSKFAAGARGYGSGKSFKLTHKLVRQRPQYITAASCFVSLCQL